MDTIINLKELERNKQEALKEVMTPISFIAKDELLNNATIKLKSIATDYKLSEDELFTAAESNELPFAVASEVLSLISKIRLYNQE